MVAAAEPSFVDKIVLSVADPGRCEHLSLVLGALCLFFSRFHRARPDNHVIVTGNLVNGDRVEESVAFPVLIRVGCPIDILLGSVVLQKIAEDLLAVVE